MLTTVQTLEPSEFTERRGNRRDVSPIGPIVRVLDSSGAAETSSTGKDHRGQACEHGKKLPHVWGTPEFEYLPCSANCRRARSARVRIPAGLPSTRLSTHEPPGTLLAPPLVKRFVDFDGFVSVDLCILHP